MIRFAKHLIDGEEGATMVEYAPMVALIGAALAAVVTTLGTAIGGKFASVSNTVGDAGSGGFAGPLGFTA